MKRGFDIIYEDEYFVVLNKAAGMLTLPDRFRPELKNLLEILQTKYGKIYPVHRIDKFTSGIICFAKSQEAHKKLSTDFELRKVVKKYVAIVHGYPIDEKGEIDAAIVLLDHQNSVRINPNGKPSKTKYTLIEKFQDYALLELELVTGRRHQIRVHLAHISLPIVADGEYGKAGEWYLSSLKRKYNTKKWEVEQAMIKRQLLHSKYIKITHPITGEALEIEAEYPKDFRAMLNQLRKLNQIEN